MVDSTGAGVDYCFPLYLKNTSYAALFESTKNTYIAENAFTTKIKGQK